MKQPKAIESKQLKESSAEFDLALVPRSQVDRRRFLKATGKAAALCALIPSALALASTPENPGGQSQPDQAPAPVPAQVSSQSLAADPRRPQFHLLPARNWMNDPNGPIYWRGRYHMFMQYNPNAAVWGDMHWYHSISPDMLHWKHLPIALAPTPGGPDADGCFSGTAVVQNGVPTFIYTGVQKVPADRAEAEATLRDGHNDFKETQLYATSTDAQLRTWTKRPTPVIPKPPEGMKVTGFRDPAPWREPSLANGEWLLAVGSGTKEKGGCVLLYRSKDLQNWEYLHIVAGGNGKATGDATNPVDSGEMWECPDLFPLGSKHVLIYSTQGKVFWKIGTLDPKDLLFREEQSGVLDHGSFYAPKTQLDKSGNRILWGWIPETRPETEFRASGWAGLMSLPRVLTVGDDGRLHIAPLPTIDRLRKREQKLRLIQSTANKHELQSEQRILNACAEILCEVKPGPEPFTLDLLDANRIDGAPTTGEVVGAANLATPVSYLSIRYSRANPKELVVDRQRLQIGLVPDQPIQLRFYIDGSVIELFVNNQATLTKRFYYPGPIAPEIKISLTGNQSDITRLSQWPITPITKDRLTS